MNKCKTCCHCKSEDGNHIKRKDRSEAGSSVGDYALGLLVAGVGLGIANMLFNDDDSNDYDDGYNDDYDY